MNDQLQEFTPVDDWPILCTDRWPPGRFRDTARQAYDALAVDCGILPVSVRRETDGATVIRYRSQIPHEWTLDLLKEQEQRFKV